MTTARIERWRSAAVLLAAVASCAVTLRLGFWQLDRAAQKTALHASIVERGALPALGAADLPAAAGGVDAVAVVAAVMNRRVTLDGRWREDLTVYLENRQMNGRPGFYVVTPLVLDDGRAVAVQRGWLPRHSADRTALPTLAAAAGRVRVDGRIAPGPSRLYDFGGEAEGRIRQNLDLAAWSRETGLPLLPLSVVQDATEATAGDGLTREWLPPQPDVHKHHGYAFQWFALSALVAGLYVWFRIVVPRRRRG